MVWPTADIPTYGRGVWLECNGQSFSRTQFPQLYETLGTTKVPDYRGMFLRGYGSQSYSQDNGENNDSSTTYSSGSIGNIQGDASRRFVHYQQGLDSGGGNGTPGGYGPTDYKFVQNWPGFNSTKNLINAHDYIWTGEGPVWLDGSDWNWHALPFFKSFDEAQKYLSEEENIRRTYTLESSTSGEGEDSETTYELVEHNDEIGLAGGVMILHTSVTDSAKALPTDNEIRPVNMAVKFMIKAK